MAKLTTQRGFWRVLWDERSRRTLRTWQKNKLIPYDRIGRAVFFDPDKVRREIDERWTVRAHRRKLKLTSVEVVELAIRRQLAKYAPVLLAAALSGAAFSFPVRAQVC